MYSWVSHTWNTVKGECPHGCTYCYMKRFPQKKIRLDEKEFDTHLGAGNFIFVGSSCDMFANNIPDGWIFDTIEYTREFANSYLYQSKNPERMKKYRSLMGYTARLCTTIETNRWYPDIMKNSPAPEERAKHFREIEFNRYVTIEPIIDFDLSEMIRLIKICNPVQVNIGADSGNNHLPEPGKEKLLALIDALKEFTQIDRKTNLVRLLK